MAGVYSRTSIWQRGVCWLGVACLLAALLPVSLALAGEYPLTGMTRATISNSGKTLLIATQVSNRYSDRLGYNILMAYDIERQSVRWIACRQSFTKASFSPDDTAIVAETMGVGYREHDTLGAKLVVERSFGLVLLDGDGHETAVLDESNYEIGLSAFLDANRVIYLKYTGPLEAGVVVYDIARHTKETVTFRKQDGTPLNAPAINSLRGTEDGKVLLGIGEYPSYYIADLASGGAVPFSLEIDAREGKLRGPGGTQLTVEHVAPGRGYFTFEGVPVVQGVYRWGAYRYSPSNNAVTHLFDATGIKMSFDAAAGDGTVAYVLQKSVDLFEVVIRRGNYATAQTLPVDLGPDQPWGKCH